MDEIKQYLQSELSQISSYFKQRIFDGLKKKHKLKEDEEIDAFLYRVLDKNYDDYVKTYNAIELTKSYKYCALFELEDEAGLDDIVTKIKSCSESHAYPFNTPSADLLPTKTENVFKFTFLLQGVKNEGIDFKVYKSTYSAIVAFKEVKGVKFIEISADNVKPFLRQGDDKFFITIINKIEDWLTQVCKLTLNPLDFSNYADDFKSAKKTAQKMMLSSGSQAVLDSASSEQIILPILGEIKQLMQENSEIFNKSREAKELIENFLNQTEQEAHLPWITFLWDNEVKRKRISVKLMFSEASYTLLNFYSHYRGREGMDHAINDLLENYSKNRVSQQQSTD